MQRIPGYGCLFQVARFISECKALQQQFQEVVASADTDLQDGLKAVTALRKDINEFKRRGVDLNNAENLFSLPVTPFTILNRLDKDVSEQEAIYALYADHDAMMKERASQLWAKVDFQVGAPLNIPGATYPSLRSFWALNKSRTAVKQL